MNLALWLSRTALRSPTRPALLRGTDLVANYADFASAAAALGEQLAHRYAIQPGDRVALYARNRVDYLIALFGIWWSGAAAVPVNAGLHARELGWIVEHSGASLLLCENDGPANLPCPVLSMDSADFAEALTGPTSLSPVERDGSALAWLFYTSGTTGRPKGVQISHDNIRAMALSYGADVEAVDETHTTLYAAPMSHGAGLYCIQHVLAGARHCVPRSGGFEPTEIFALSRALRGVHFFAAPTMVKRLVEHARHHGETGEGINTIVYAGGPMYLADIVDAVELLGPRFAQIYGQGECPMAITALPKARVADRTHPRWRERLASVGTAQSVVELRVSDADGQALLPGETGEVLVRGTPVMAGYWRDPAASERTLCDGWLWTGDVGSLDEDGYLSLKDRSKDLIISGGSNIYPREVEECLLEHPQVSEVSVVGETDPEWGERVVAFVVGRAPDATALWEELDAHCLARIARFKRPRRYIGLDALPENHYGKVLKTALREQLRAGSTQNPDSR